MFENILPIVVGFFVQLYCNLYLSIYIYIYIYIVCAISNIKSSSSIARGWSTVYGFTSFTYFLHIHNVSEHAGRCPLKKKPWTPSCTQPVQPLSPAHVPTAYPPKGNLTTWKNCWQWSHDVSATDVCANQTNMISDIWNDHEHDWLWPWSGKLETSLKYDNSSGPIGN